MPQLFSARAQLLVRTAIAAGLAGCVAGVMLWYAIPRSDDVTLTRVAISQPVPFSHRHHVGQIGIDCRYCHQTVETAATAGMPSTDTCMNCHSQLWTNAALLEPVRDSWNRGVPIRWNRVHDVPDFVYFNHAVHVNNGVSCVSCHGRVDQMALTEKVRPLFMSGCLDCHRDPGMQLRPKDAIFTMDWKPPKDREQLAKNLMQAYHIDTTGLTNCSACHR